VPPSLPTSVPGLRIHRAGLEPGGPWIAIDVDGRATQALAGESLAATLTATGQLALRRHAQGGGSRGLYCGMGVCFDCRVSVDGRPGERACLTMVRPGMQVRTGADADMAMAPPRAESESRREEGQVLVLGAGPAGLAAAEAAAVSGLTVTILDERPAPGGQFYKPVAASHRVQGGADGQPDRQFAAGAKLVDLVRALGVRIYSHCTVWDAQARAGGGVTLHAIDEQGPLEISAAKLVVATGAYERSWPVPGWTLPGVMNTGAAQTLARAYQVAAGRRVLIAGNGPLNLQVAADLVRNGVEVVAVAEAARSPFRAKAADLIALARIRTDLVRDGLGYLAALRKRGVPVLYGHVLVRVEGEGRAERAVLARVAPDGTLRAGSEKSFAVDVVCTGYGFAPSTELTRLIGCAHEVDARHSPALVAVRDEDCRTSNPDVFVAGDAGGPWGAHAALNQGRIAGLAAARDLAGEDGGRAAQSREAQAALARETAFQRSLWRVFAAPECGTRLAADDTVVCRCENVAFGAVRREIAQGATDLATIKRSTRCGMGHCQGRYCSPTIARMLAETGPVTEATYFRVQAPLRPVAMDALAKVQPDISVFASLAESAPPQEGDPGAMLDAVDTVVIGGGIVGLCTARELARAGQTVAVLERNQPHAEASGANAGSLHVQFQTFGFPDLTIESAVRAPVSTLAMQRDSVYLWDEFASESDADIEAEIDGGLTVADDEASLVHLRRKVAWERGAGLSIEMLSGEEARSLAPYLAPGVIAASLSRDEGKINPLKAAPAMLASTLASGVKVHSHARVLSIARTASGFRIATQRGSILAKRVVNAAGAWAGEVGALAGDALPVRPNPIHMLVTEALPPLIPYHLAHATRRLTLKQAAHGNLIIGGGWRASWDAQARRMRPSLQGISGNLAVVTRILPGLGPLLVIRSWTGTAFVTQPAIGESAKVPGLFHAITQNGMTLGPAAGRLCADLILGRPTRWDARPFSPARFS
jgi:glycine/D-amino acid oxidase-like deaminating enzyme/bacterioferritin-associated ferredoxin